MKKFNLTLICLFVMSVTTFAQWTQKASMYNYGRRSTFGCSINGKGYTGLGSIYDNTYVNDFWEYDTLTNMWTKKASYPGAGLYENTSFAINGKLYVCLGFSSSYVCQTDLWEYNPVNNTWTQKASFPGAGRYGARAFVIGDSAFVVAGSFGGGNNYYYDMYMYNPTTNNWKPKASFSGGSRSNGTAFSIAGFGYFGAGLSDGTTPTKDFWKYNPTTNSWSSIPDFPGTARNSPVNFVINDKAFVGLGGNPSSTICYNDFYVYNPVANTWQQLITSATISSRTSAIAFSFGNIGYVGLGLNTIGVFTDLWAFDSTSVLTNLENNTSNIDYLKVFPNPSNASITIENKTDKSEKFILTLTDIEGREILKKNIDFLNTYNLDISDFENGIYFLSMQNNKKRMLQKIVLQK